MSDLRWYRNTVIYSLDLETFLDSNGDGTGDFEGLIRRLDYLQFLGVGAVWLAPFHPSPNRDNGYDVADYYGVDPCYGSSGQFVEFMQQAKNRGIRVLMDLVTNHTSDQHRWFQSARADPDSRYRDFYVWAQGQPEGWDEGMVFPGVQERTWTWDEKAQAYYFHRFFDFQPDLDMDNPRVREEVKRIIGYWLQLGVEGFRVDAVPFLIETTTPGAHRHEMHFEYLAEFRRFVQWHSGSAILLGEANVTPEETAAYFETRAGEGIHMMFNFWVNQHLFYALASGDVAPLVEAIQATAEIPADAQWANFLRNHDELDLGRLSDEQRQKVFARFGPEERMQLYGRGIRRRLAPMLRDRRLEELAYSVLFALPGTPVIRYGDELRMGDDLSLEERAAVRTPMQWADAPNGGFSTADRTVHPVIDEGAWGYSNINVAEQRRDPDSFLNWIAGMIRMRLECPEVGTVRPRLLDVEAEGVLVMEYVTDVGSLVIVHNFGDAPADVRLRLEREPRPLEDLRAPEQVEAQDGEYRMSLGPMGYRWLRWGGLGYEAPARPASQGS